MSALAFQMKRLLPLLAAVVALLALALPAPLRAEPEQLKVAKYNFEYGKYDESLKIVDGLLAGKLIADETDLVEAYRIQGLSHFYLGQRNEARTSFVNLLSVEPDYALDPLLVPPAAIVEFDAVKKENESLLAPIRQRRQAIAEQKRLQEEARRKLLEEEERRRREQVNGPVVMQRVESHPLFANFLPFGAAQIDQGRSGMGTVLAVGEGLSIATSILAYTQVHSRLGSDGKVSEADFKSATNWKLVNQTSFALALAFYVGGVVDAFVHYEPETTSYVAVPREKLAPPRPPGASTTPVPMPVPKSESPKASLFVAPITGGGAAGFNLRF